MLKAISSGPESLQCCLCIYNMLSCTGANHAGRVQSGVAATEQVSKEMGGRAVQIAGRQVRGRDSDG